MAPALSSINGAALAMSLDMRCFHGLGSALGGMAEWFKAAVLKTVDRKVRGFESLSLRQ